MFDRTAGMSTDWIDNHVTLPSDGYSRIIVVFHYCTIVAVSATSDMGAHVGRGAVL